MFTAGAYAGSQRVVVAASLACDGSTLSRMVTGASIVRHVSVLATLVALGIGGSSPVSAQPSRVEEERVVRSLAEGPPEIRPRPAPTPMQVDALRLLEREVNAFAQRAVQYRADLEAMGDRRAAESERQRRTLLVPEPLAPLPPPRDDLAAVRDLPPDLDAAVARLAAVLDQNAGLPVALRVDALHALADVLSHSSPDARARQLVARIAGAPSTARPSPVGALTRAASPADFTGLVPATPTLQWTTLVGDRPWRIELWQQLAADALHSGDLPTAVVWLRLLGARYPLDPSAPRARLLLVDALDRMGRTDDALAARASFVDFTVGSTWSNAHRENPTLFRDTDAAVEQLRRSVEGYRARAEGLRAGASRAARPVEAAALRAAAQIADGNAAAALALLLRDDLALLDAYELRLQRAEALSRAGRHNEAAHAYVELRESNEDDEHLVKAALRAVDETEAYVEALVARGEVDACAALRAGVPMERIVDARGVRRLTQEQIATCASLPRTEQEIPPPIQQWMDVRLAYANRVPASLDGTVSLITGVVSTRRRGFYAYLNAQTLLRLGHVRDAERLYQEIIRVYCDDAALATMSLNDLGSLYDAQGRTREFSGLRHTLESCSRYGYPGPPGPLPVWHWALNSFRQAEHATPDRATALYEQAAREFESALLMMSRHPEESLATFYFALASERSGRPETARQTYLRIVRDYHDLVDANGAPLSGEERSQRINILEVATFRAAVNAEHFCDFDGAIASWHAVLADPRFEVATDRLDHVHDALASIASLETNRGRWGEAAKAWRAFIVVAQPGAELAEAEFRAAETSARAGSLGSYLAPLDAYLSRRNWTASDGQYRVRATWLRANWYAGRRPP